MAIPSSERIAFLPSPEQIKALLAALDAFPNRIRERGVRYFEEDRVGPLMPALLTRMLVRPRASTDKLYTGQQEWRRAQRARL